MADQFDKEFDRIAMMVDPERFENRKREEAVGPLLTEAVRLLHEAGKTRDDYLVMELDREGDRQCVMLLHNEEKATLLAMIWLRATEDGTLILWAEEATNSPFSVTNRHYSVGADSLSVEWMKAALAQIMSEMTVRRVMA